MVCGNSTCCGNKNCMKTKEDKEDSSEDLNDIWGDEVEVNNTADIKRIHTKQGYLDGLSHAKESSLQSGFDDAYPKGADIGIQVGYILATVAAKAPEKLQECREDLVISKVLAKSYFSQDLEMENNVILSKWTEFIR